MDPREEGEENSCFSLDVPSFPKRFWVALGEGAEIGEKIPKLWNLELFPVEMGWEMGGMRILLHLHVGMRDLLG